MPGIIKVDVLPAYGKKECVIQWVPSPELRSANFLVQRSLDGVTRWETLNTPGQEGVTEFVDKDFVVTNVYDKIHYRVIALKDGKRYDSPAVSFFGTLSKCEFGALRQILNLENMRMSPHQGKNGIEVLLYKRLMYGTPCPKCTDEDTNQSLGRSKCPNCFGVGIVGGYAKPVKTFMEIVQQPQHQETTNEEGMNLSSNRKLQVRMLCYPMPRTGDLLVHPDTDDRYFIGNNIQPFFFKNVFPVNAMLEMEKINRSDIVYRVTKDHDPKNFEYE